MSEIMEIDLETLEDVENANLSVQEKDPNEGEQDWSEENKQQMEADLGAEVISVSSDIIRWEETKDGNYLVNGGGVDQIVSQGEAEQMLSQYTQGECVTSTSPDGQEGHASRLVNEERTIDGRRIVYVHVENFEVSKPPEEEIPKEELVLPEIPAQDELFVISPTDEEASPALVEQVETTARNYAADEVSLPVESILEAPVSTSENTLEIAQPIVTTIPDIPSSNENIDIAPSVIETVMPAQEVLTSAPLQTSNVQEVVQITHDDFTTTELLPQPPMAMGLNFIEEVSVAPAVDDLAFTESTPTPIVAEEIPTPVEFPAPHIEDKIAEVVFTTEQITPQPKNILAEVRALETAPISIAKEQGMSAIKPMSATETTQPISYTPDIDTPTKEFTLSYESMHTKVPEVTPEREFIVTQDAEKILVVSAAIQEQKVLEPIASEPSSIELPLVPASVAPEKIPVLEDDLAITHEPLPPRQVEPNIAINTDPVITLELPPKSVPVIEKPPEPIDQVLIDIPQPQPPVVEITTAVSNELLISTVEVTSVDQPEKIRIVKDDLVITHKTAPGFNGEKPLLPPAANEESISSRLPEVVQPFDQIEESAPTSSPIELAPVQSSPPPPIIPKSPPDIVLAPLTQAANFSEKTIALSLTMPNDQPEATLRLEQPFASSLVGPEITRPEVTPPSPAIEVSPVIAPEPTLVTPVGFEQPTFPVSPTTKTPPVPRFETTLPSATESSTHIQSEAPTVQPESAPNTPR